MLTCNGCAYRKGTACLHYKVPEMDPSRRCRSYRNKAYGARFPVRGNPYSKLEYPVWVSERVVVIPAHGDYLPEENEIAIRMDAGPAFGNGAHPTTALCVGMIEDYLEEGDLFLDVGTGSGILMIASAKLGAEKVCGVDKDPAAVEIARDNLLLNGIEEHRFELRVGNLLEDVRGGFDLVAANILTEVLHVLMDDLRGILKQKGYFVCSGMIEKNTHRVVSKMDRLGFEIIEERTDRGWVCMAARRRD